MTLGRGTAGDGEEDVAEIPEQPSLVELAPDTDFAGYRIIRKLGAGAMAAVYLARQSKSDQLVALKVMRAELGVETGQEFLERFRNEIRTAGALSHANIVRAYEAGEADGVYYLAMEYVEGESLLQLVEKA